MSIDRARTADPLDPGHGAVRGIAWWGMLIGILALATFLASVVASYLYLRSGAEAWPPAGVDPPAIARPLLATALVVAAAAATSAAHRAIHRGNGAVLFAGLMAGMALAGGALALHATDLAALPIGFADHAYASLVWLLRGFEAAVVAAGVVMSATMLAQYAAGHIDAGRHQHVSVTALYWWFVASSSVAVFVTVTLVPHL